jgi:nitrite reductase (NO-forming)
MIVAMLAIGSMLLAACGGSSNKKTPTAAPAPTQAAPAATTAPTTQSPTTGAVSSPAAVASPVGAASPVAAASPAASPGASPAASANEVTVIMGKPSEFRFDPSEFTIPANTDVTVHLTNEGSTTHDFSIDALKISKALDVGQSADITINAPAGDYQYYCNIPGHKEGGMVGTLHVK